MDNLNEHAAEVASELDAENELAAKETMKLDDMKEEEVAAKLEDNVY